MGRHRLYPNSDIKCSYGHVIRGLAMSVFCPSGDEEKDSRSPRVLSEDLCSSVYQEQSPTEKHTG